MITLDMQSRTPIYEQLKTKISELILLDVLKPFEQLPSVRMLARDLGVNPNTVQKAYQDLERDGIIYSVSGKGSFVSKNEGCNDSLRKQYLFKLNAAAIEACTWGIPLQKALDVVTQAYKEGHKA